MRCLALLVLVASGFATQSEVAYAAENEKCQTTKEASLDKIERVFRPKEDLLLKIIGALQAKGIDPHKFPVVEQNGALAPVDIIQAFAVISAIHSKAARDIDAAATKCLVNEAPPEQMTALADASFRDASFITRWLDSISAADLILGSPFGGPNALTPKLRDDILKRLRPDIVDGGACLGPGCATPVSLSPLDKALSKLVAGNLAFNTPQRMAIDRPRLVEVKLSTSLSPSELKAQLTEEGNREVARLSVGDRMSATLIGGAAFDVAPSGPQTQWISATKVTTWTWNVTPKLRGEQYLILSFDAVISINGKDGTRNIRTLTQKIDVEVGLPRTFDEWFDFGKKWFENASWLWASVLLPIGVLLVAGWRRLFRANP